MGNPVKFMQGKEYSLIKFNDSLFEFNKICVIGDSIAFGQGWNDGTTKNNENDGICPFIRNAYPKCIINNYSVAGCTISSSQSNNLASQVAKIDDDCDCLIIICGINDVGNSLGGNTWKVGYPIDRVLTTQYKNNNDNSYACGYLENLFYMLSIQKPDMKIYFVIEPTTTNINYYPYQEAFCYYKYICDKYDVNVIDTRGLIPNMSNPNKKGLTVDGVHPTQKGYQLLANYIMNKISINANDNYKEIPITMTLNGEFNTDVYYLEPGNFTNVVEQIVKRLFWIDNWKGTVTFVKNATQPNTCLQCELANNYNTGWIKLRTSSFNGQKYNELMFYYMANIQETTVSYLVYGVPQYVIISDALVPNLNITSCNQLRKPGTYYFNNASAIADLPNELKSSFCMCEVLVNLSNYIIQRWTSITDGLIYMVYSKDGTVTYKKVVTQ